MTPSSPPPEDQDSDSLGVSDAEGSDPVEPPVLLGEDSVAIAQILADLRNATESDREGICMKLTPAQLRLLLEAAGGEASASKLGAATSTKKLLNILKVFANGMPSTAL